MALILLRPSWQHGALFHPDSGKPWPDASTGLNLSGQAISMAGYWLEVFRELADPADPWRCALLDPASASRLAAEGRWALEALEADLGKGTVAYQPQARPEPTHYLEEGYRFMPDYECWPIWFLPESAHAGDISPDTLGLSWGLARHVEQWALAFDESIDLKSPTACEVLWTAQRFREHREEGLLLFRRLRAELDRSGRSATRLSFEYPPH